MHSPSEIAALTRQLVAEVHRFATATPLEPVPYLSTGERHVLAKREDLQVTGSFKFRGAVAKLATLSDEELSGGVVAASTGNHGLAVACAASARNSTATVYVPTSAHPGKLAKIEAAGGVVERVNGNALAAEQTARRAAARDGSVYVSPYNDAAVVAGQGTIGHELRDQVSGPFTLVASVGGGGLIAGTAASLQGRLSAVVGTSPAVDAAMAASVAAGAVVPVSGGPTLSDGTAGDLEPDTITLSLCAELVDEWVLQPELRIAAAASRHLEATGVTVEGSAALALATAADLDVTGLVVVIICGGNV